LQIRITREQFNDFQRQQEEGPDGELVKEIKAICKKVAEEGTRLMNEALADPVKKARLDEVGYEQYKKEYDLAKKKAGRKD
jgi:hypothetical protein